MHTGTKTLQEAEGDLGSPSLVSPPGLGFYKVLEGSLPNSRKARWLTCPPLLYKHILRWPGTCWAIPPAGPTSGWKHPWKTFALSSQAFVSDQEGEEEASHVHGSFPCVSADQGIPLTPSPSLPLSKFTLTNVRGFEVPVALASSSCQR